MPCFHTCPSLETAHVTRRWKPKAGKTKPRVFLLHNVMGNIAYFGDQVQFS